MRIGLTQLGCIGDAILLTSCFESIRSRYPDCEIDVVAGEGNYFIFDEHPDVARVLVYRKSLWGALSFARQLRRFEYDFYIDPKDHHSSESSIIAKLARASVKIGFNRESGGPFTIGVPPSSQNSGKHYVARLATALESAGVHCPPRQRPSIALHKDSVEFANSFTNSSAKELLLLNISAGSRDRIWQTEKWAEVLLSPELGRFDIFVTSSPADRAEAVRLCSMVPGLKHYETRNFHDLVAMIARAKLLLTPDTAAVHVASALNVSMAAVYGGRPDNTAKYYPLMDNFAIAEAAEGTDSVSGVSAEELRNAILQVL